MEQTNPQTAQVSNDTNDFPVTLTTKAIEMIKSALKEEGLEDHGLRIAVQGGGCSGLQYGLDFEKEERMGDVVSTVDGLKIFIDMASANFLKGTSIDYVTSLQGAGFKFNNPNAKRTCGCGSSFS
ncbi:iron-sulfur cluster assembly accessory protein [bacterium]|nr:iron-sulfur cluster assembly accessory protein [bacterium]